MLIPKAGRVVSKKITDAARGEECTLQIPGFCNQNPETVVFCHFPDDTHGVGMKSDDLSGGFGCSGCHDVIDGRVATGTRYSPKVDKDFYLRRSQTRTMRRLFQLGVVKVA